MSPRNQITVSRVDARAGSLCHYAGTRKGKGRVEIVMAFVSQAIKRYWSSLPPGRSNLQRLVRNENGVILRLVHSSFRLLVRKTSSFRESIAIDFTECANENIGRIMRRRKKFCGTFLKDLKSCSTNN